MESAEGRTMHVRGDPNMDDRTLQMLGELADAAWHQFAPLHGKCRVCGCTNDDCAGCVERTGIACYWVDDTYTLCSACVGEGVNASRTA
jgi:hypothetical protein